MNFRKKITNCGAPVYLLSMPHVTSIAVGVLVNVGARDERPEQSGISHALEHMVHQGNRRCSDMEAISGEIETIGGDLNAYTGNECTFYYRIVPDDALDMAVTSIESQLATSHFRPEDVKKEMQNVVAEIRDCRDNPRRHCWHEFHQQIFGDHPLGKSVVGTEESVSGFRQSDFISFHDRYYHPDNYTFIVVGNTTMERVLWAFRHAFVFQKKRGKNVRPLVPVTATASSRHIAHSIQQANIYLGTAVPGSDPEIRGALDFYATMIGGGMSFPLFQEVRNKRGLCYHVEAGLSEFSDSSVFTVYTACDRQRVQEAVSSIHQVIDTSCTKDIFERARSSLLGQYKVSLYSSPRDLLHAAVGDITILGHPRDPQEYKSAIESLRLKHIRDIVDKYLIEGSYVYTCVGPEGTAIDPTSRP